MSEMIKVAPGFLAHKAYDKIPALFMWDPTVINMRNSELISYVSTWVNSAFPDYTVVYHDAITGGERISDFIIIYKSEDYGILYGKGSKFGARLKSRMFYKNSMGVRHHIELDKADKLPSPKDYGTPFYEVREMIKALTIQYAFFGAKRESLLDDDE